jgi:hypothetical protein
MSASRKYYYWLVCSDSGKKFVIYGGLTEDDARAKGLEELSGINFEIRRLPTRDRDAASAYIRGKRLEETHSLKKASQRLGHEKSIARLHRKLRRVMRFRPE